VLDGLPARYVPADAHARLPHPVRVPRRRRASFAPDAPLVCPSAPVFLAIPERITLAREPTERKPMGRHHDDNPAAAPAAPPRLRAKDLCDLEEWFREKGLCEFRYDESLDVFRFAEDGRFAFCRDFADWRLLEARGYLALSDSSRTGAP
jgi:hypothetical protein